MPSRLESESPYFVSFIMNLFIFRNCQTSISNGLSLMITLAVIDERRKIRRGRLEERGSGT